MTHEFEHYGPYADSNRVSVWGPGQTAEMIYVPLEKGELPPAIANVAPVLIYDRLISAIQKKVNELEATMEELKRSATVTIQEVIELRDISLDQAMIEIKEFFETHHGNNLDAGHIMESLCIDYDLIEKALNELEKEGKIREVNYND